MGLFDTLLAQLSPAARRRLAEEAAKGAVKEVGDRVYEHIDGVRRDIEGRVEAREQARAHEQAERDRAAEAARAEAEIEDELARLKRALDDDPER